MLLDKIQKRITIDHADHRILKRAKLVEGRFPNLFIAGGVAKLTGQEARYIRERGFNKRYYLDLIKALIKEAHGQVSRKQIDYLLIDKLPEVLTEKQKKAKVHNLLSELSRNNEIRNSGSRAQPKWEIVETGDNLTKKKQ